MVADALSKSRPPRQEDQEAKQIKTNQTSAMEVDLIQAQDRDQELFSLIQTSSISLTKTRAKQFLKAQITDPDIQKMVAQSKKELKRQIYKNPFKGYYTVWRIGVGSIVPQTRDHGRASSWSPHWTRRSTSDCGPHQASLLMERPRG